MLALLIGWATLCFAAGPHGAPTEYRAIRQAVGSFDARAYQRLFWSDLKKSEGARRLIAAAAKFVATLEPAEKDILRKYALDLDRARKMWAILLSQESALKESVGLATGEEKKTLQRELDRIAEARNQAHQEHERILVAERKQVLRIFKRAGYEVDEGVLLTPEGDHLYVGSDSETGLVVTYDASERKLDDKKLFLVESSRYFPGSTFTVGKRVGLLSRVAIDLSDFGSLEVRGLSAESYPDGTVLYNSDPTVFVAESLAGAKVAELVARNPLDDRKLREARRVSLSGYGVSP